MAQRFRKLMGSDHQPNPALLEIDLDTAEFAEKVVTQYAAVSRKPHGLKDGEITDIEIHIPEVIVTNFNFAGAVGLRRDGAGVCTVKIKRLARHPGELLREDVGARNDD